MVVKAGAACPRSCCQIGPSRPSWVVVSHNKVVLTGRCSAGPADSICEIPDDSPDSREVAFRNVMSSRQIFLAGHWKSSAAPDCEPLSDANDSQDDELSSVRFPPPRFLLTASLEPLGLPCLRFSAATTPLILSPSAAISAAFHRGRVTLCHVLRFQMSRMVLEVTPNLNPRIVGLAASSVLKVFLPSTSIARDGRSRKIASTSSRLSTAPTKGRGAAGRFC
mmetsp:Transcript_57994/g.136166  ORF Transcript_57994/g.136166 Transcript_57994/m.136166 type:complete len:222 (+) Transcript_57994:481-1146(+)